MFYLEIAIKVESLLIHLQFVRTRNGARPTDTLTHRCTLHPDKVDAGMQEHMENIRSAYYIHGG